MRVNLKTCKISKVKILMTILPEYEYDTIINFNVGEADAVVLYP